MKKLFYYYFTEYVIKQCVILFLRLKGVKINTRIIVLSAGYTNKIDNSSLRVGFVKGFSIVWVNRLKIGFDVEIKFYSSSYANGSYYLKDFLKLLKAQSWLENEYPLLPDYEK